MVIEYFPVSENIEGVHGMDIGSMIEDMRTFILDKIGAKKSDLIASSFILYKNTSRIDVEFDLTISTSGSAFPLGMELEERPDGISVKCVRFHTAAYLSGINRLEVTLSVPNSLEPWRYDGRSEDDAPKWLKEPDEDGAKWVDELIEDIFEKR